MLSAKRKQITITHRGAWRWLALTLALSIGLGITPAHTEEVLFLKRGINLSHWLQYDGRQPIVAADMVMIRQAGFDHVRIPFDPLHLGWNPDIASAAATARPTLDFTPLDQAVNLALQADLAVILDFHPEAPLRHRI